MGCDIIRRYFCFGYYGFNLRTHMGCDTEHVCRIIKKVSFNLRTHMGCDILLYKVNQYFTRFQSTHPHGVRLCILW